MINITSAEFENEVLKSDKLVMIDFFAVWCGPCKMVGPIVESVAEECKDSCKVLKVNIDESPELAQQYKVMAVPTIMFFKNGQVVDTTVGAVPKSELIAKIEKLK
ncbi:thioredoxin [Tyzzerella sp. An114]|uniref:thioredoxin n=1 Tax=Tyzzerella sp. An114 TaxID=1965545 RepID=UPI000B43B343|nr:thioredoxin [Tyzzerella sp. An114]OUQ57933.1 thioredoxin [Tyzzerella sp. An114]